MMIFTLAARELRSLFVSPLAWAILAVTQFIMGYLFLSQLDVFMQLQPRLAGMEGAPGLTQLVVVPVFANASIIVLLLIPLLTMRLVSEELRSQTLPLLFSAPVSMTEIILGKFFGIMGFLMIMLAMIALMPISLLLGGKLDTGLLISCLLGLFLLLASFAAAGLFISSLTAQPTVAGVTTFGLLLLLWILDWAGGNASGENTSNLFRYVSMLNHYQSLLRGAFNSTDIVYYLLFISGFLALGIRRLDAYRLQH